MVRTPDDGSIQLSKDLYAYSAIGEGTPRVMSACPPSRPEPSTERCSPWSWHPERPTLLVQRIPRDRRGVLEAWTPETGSHVVVGQMFAERWLAPNGTSLLAKPEERGRRLLIVDVKDVTAPEISDVPTSELHPSSAPSPRRTAAGCWPTTTTSAARRAGSRRSTCAARRRGRTGKSIAPSTTRSTARLVSERHLRSHRRIGRMDRVRAARIDLETGAKSSIRGDLRSGAEQLLVELGGTRLARRAHDGNQPRRHPLSLAIGAPLSDAAPLTYTPDWAIPFWRPSNGRP